MDKETARMVAEYMSLAMHLNNEASTANDFRRANELSWYLGMVMPAPLYNSIVMAVSCPNEKCNFVTVIADVRTALGESVLPHGAVASHLMRVPPIMEEPASGALN